MVIELSGVHYGYNGRKLLSGIDLHLAPGSFHFLTGPSGSGKTTLLKLCYLELRPDAGALRVLGTDIRTMNRDAVARMRRRIGVVHQDCRFLDHLPVDENIALPLSVAEEEAQTSAADLDELIAWVGLGERRDALPSELSGGERQRAALARAIAGSPDLILADEPTGNIDWDMARRLLQLLIELNRMGKTVLIATHDLNLIRTAKNHVAARVLRLRGGGLELAGAEL